MQQITGEQARNAIRQGDFGVDITHAADRVAVILTQGWCPQWHAMRQYVAGFSGAQIFYLEYDRTDCFDAFKNFKEQVLGNDQIPYLRYYCRGVLVAQSNAVSESTFRAHLEQHCQPAALDT
jgi:hypothetical protein